MTVADSSGKTIVLLGVGHTNLHVVRQWAHQPIVGCRLVCVSNFPTLTYSGMLPGLLAGQFRMPDLSIDLPQLCVRAGAELVLAETTGLTLDNPQLTFADRGPLPFDFLSIGVGSMPAGWQEHSQSPHMVAIKPMQTFADRLHKVLGEVGRGRRLRVAVVGGGVASVEIALCLQSQRMGANALADVDIDIFTSSSHVAEGMTARSVRRIEQVLQRRDITIYAKARVTEVNATQVVTDSGQRIATDCVIWATGAAAPPMLAQLGLQTDPRGFVATNAALQSLSDSRVFAVGDAGTVTADPSPKAGVVAVRQGPILWHNLQAVVNGGSLKDFQPQQNYLKLLNTGDGRALLEYGPITFYARWCWYLKTWIDKRFIAR